MFELVSVYFLLKGNLPENELDDIKGGLRLLDPALPPRLVLPLSPVPQGCVLIIFLSNENLRQKAAQPLHISEEKFFKI